MRTTVFEYHNLCDHSHLTSFSLFTDKETEGNYVWPWKVIMINKWQSKKSKSGYPDYQLKASLHFSEILLITHVKF